MSTSTIIFISTLAVFIIAIIVTIKNRNKAAIKPEADKHPASYKKPDIEMVNHFHEKKKNATLYNEATKEE